MTPQVTSECLLGGGFALFNSAESLAAQKPCLAYEPSAVSNSGILLRKTFPGLPSYESVEQGDTAETYWFARLLAPLCVDEDKVDPDLNHAQQGITEVQLVVQPDAYKRDKALVGKRFIARAMLSGGAPRPSRYSGPVDAQIP